MEISRERDSALDNNDTQAAVESDSKAANQAEASGGESRRPQPSKQVERPVSRPRAGKTLAPRTLAIDIGGTGVKAAVLDADGRALKERARVPTPHPATPEAILGAIEQLAQAQGAFERISVGFPGVVSKGVVHTAKNLSVEWEGFNLAKTLREKFSRPARVANDADVQGMGVIKGRGTELVITLGTGFGSSLFIEGTLIPNIQLSRNPFQKGKTYEDRLGHVALEKAGKKKWNKRLAQAIELLEETFNYSNLYIGGGNAKHVTLKLPRNVRTVSNEEGVLGGIALWRDSRSAATQPPARSKPERS